MRKRLAHIIGSLSLWVMERLDPDDVKEALTPKKETLPDPKDLDSLKKEVKVLPPAIEVPIETAKTIESELTCLRSKPTDVGACLRVREVLERLPGFVADPEIEWQLDLNFSVEGRCMYFAPMMLNPRHAVFRKVFDLNKYLCAGVTANPNTKSIS